MTLREIASGYYQSNRGNEKPAHYFDFYEDALTVIGRSGIALLELGVHSGSSLLIWHSYLQDSRIVGVDILPMPESIRGLVDDQALGFVQADQGSPDLLDKVLFANDGRPYDIIIDDASHIGAPTKAAFRSLFSRGLRDGGYYVIEDYGTGYWPDWPDGAALSENLGSPMPATPTIMSRLNPFRRTTAKRLAGSCPSHHAGAVGVVKQLIDELNFPQRPAGICGDGVIDRLIYLPAIMAVIKGQSRS